jgi:hypothetical protein
MANSTSIATESTRAAAVQNTADYTTGVGAHLAGDWFHHNQMNLQDQIYDITVSPPDDPHAAHSVVSAILMRFLVQIDSVEHSIVVPAVAAGPFVGVGTWSGSPSAVAPTFTLQPQSEGYVAGQRVTLTVAVDGTPPTLIQWYKNGVVIPGERSTSYLISAFSVSDAGDYVCAATNSVGQTLSNTATLSLKTTTGESVPSRII